MNDWLTYFVVIVLVFFVVSGVQFFLKSFRSKEVTFKTPFVEAKFEPDPNALSSKSKFSQIVPNLVVTLILSVIILASINSFFPRPALVNTNTPHLSVTNIPITSSILGIGSTQVSKIDSMIQVYVPAGAFTMGNDDSKYPDEQPIHAVMLDAFWIDKFEVTNLMYGMCVKAGKCSLPQSPKSSTRTAYFSNPQYNNYPVIYVTWENAHAYCGWAGQRLPTEAEWEKAARGTDGRIYPWGNKSPDKTLLNFNRDVDDTTEVGKYPSGASPYGVLDMAGSVWEWVQSKYKAYPYNANDGREKLDGSDDVRVLRGGAWDNYGIDVRVSLRNWVTLSGVDNDVGFRCASSP